MTDDKKYEIKTIPTVEYIDFDIIIFLKHIYSTQDSKYFSDLVYKQSLETTRNSFKYMLNTFADKYKHISLVEKIQNAQTTYPNSYYYKNKTIENYLNELDNQLYLKEELKHMCDDFFKENYTIEPTNLQKEIQNPEAENMEILIKEHENVKIKDVLFQIKELWSDLYFKYNSSLICDRSTMIPLKHSFTIPGGRFHEIYYWDTYWIILGQIQCNMMDSVYKMILNFVDLINDFNAIPNGTRKYYTNRSQPPFFAQMVYFAYKRQPLIYLNNFFVDSMIKEYCFWEENRTIIIEKNGINYKLNRYYVECCNPRVECPLEDIQTFEEFIEDFMKNNGKIKDIEEFVKVESNLYSNIQAAAESGWDFSTRFMKDSQNLYTICTKEIVPVDLNALMYSNELIISEMLKGLNRDEESKYFTERANTRSIAINSVLWNSDCWYDFNFKEITHNQKYFYFSNITPLLYGINPPVYGASEILYKYHEELFGYLGGVPASNNKNSNHQWDYPNVWPPHQHLLIEYLLKVDSSLSLYIARKFFRSVYSLFLKDNARLFYEKYHAESFSDAGLHGEYKVQTGFGWTNGTIIFLIQIFGEELLKETEDPANEYAIIVEILKKRSKIGIIKIEETPIIETDEETTHKIDV